MDSDSIFFLPKMDLSTIQDAYRRVQAHRICTRTPIINSRAIDSALSHVVGRPVEIHFKCEHLQEVGSFKIRGALNFALSLTKDVLANGLVTHSSGNHGIAVACVGSYLNVPVSVIVPSSIPLGKLDKIKFYGATVHFCEPTLHERQTTCARIAKLNGMTEVPPFDHEWIIAGQGTQTIEIYEDLPDFDAIVVAVGGGGLISGIITAAKGLKSGVKVFGVEPCNVDDAYMSLKQGVRRGPTTEKVSTICDALTVSPVGEKCWPILSGGCDAIFRVSDQEVISAMKICITDLNQLVEPSGACALAGVLSTSFVHVLQKNHAISKIVVVICGGNLGLDVFQDLVS